MGNDDFFIEVLGDLEHGVQIGSIVFQMPEDEKMITVLMQCLGKQVAQRPIRKAEALYRVNLCPTCNRAYWENKALPNYCSSCGQKFDLV